MCEGSQRECVLIDVGRIAQQRFHEIAGADIVQKVAKELFAKRVVTHVLHQTSPVNKGMRLLQVLGGSLRESLEQQRLNVFLPGEVDDLFVGKHGVTAQDTPV